jgi:hypothetical protein
MTDDRVTCTSCRHYRPGQCGNHRAARLMTPVIGPHLANLPQRCHGFKGRK